MCSLVMIMECVVLITLDTSSIKLFFTDIVCEDMVYVWFSAIFVNNLVCYIVVIIFSYVMWYYTFHIIYCIMVMYLFSWLTLVNLYAN